LIRHRFDLAQHLPPARAHGFKVEHEAMERIHEGGFEKNCNRNLHRHVFGTALVRLVGTARRLAGGRERPGADRSTVDPIQRCWGCASSVPAAAMGGVPSRQNFPCGPTQRSGAQLFSEPLLSARRRMRRRVRSRVLTSIRTAAGNFALLLAIVTPPTAVPSFMSGLETIPAVYGSNRAGLCS
jgi:hypothetical protein